jgi:hypothetical protein
MEALAADAPDGCEVVDLMEVLERSLEGSASRGCQGRRRRGAAAFASRHYFAPQSGPKYPGKRLHRARDPSARPYSLAVRR